MRVLQALTAAALATLASAANATIVDSWNYNVDMNFNSCVFQRLGPLPPDPSGGPTTCNPKLVEWGDRIPQSNLTLSPAITGNTVNTAINHNPNCIANPLECGPAQTLTHGNNTIPGNSNFLDSVKIAVSVELQAATVEPGFTPINPLGTFQPPIAVVNFLVDFKETDNRSCATGAGDPPCPDIFVLTGNLNQEFWYDVDTDTFASSDPSDPDYNKYFLSVFPKGGFAPLSPGACAEAGVSSPCFGFLTPEGGDRPKDFALSITTERIDLPEPGVLALFALGLVGLGFTIRRRQV